MKWLGFVVYGIYVLTIVWLLINAVVQLHLLWLTRKKSRHPRKTSLDSYPYVTIQAPVYNEKYVIEKLLDSLAKLDYPLERLEIQVLDDSTDETSAIIDDKAAQLKRLGIDIIVHRRSKRDGYKAGALQEGLRFCKGELIAIFDADFRPPSNFLLSLVPHFQDGSIGWVQARWGHLNDKENFLTRIQSYLLDTHFVVEQAGRFNAGYFTNFCGTAGIWRKTAIEEAGGWDGSVLSEDLDLSYRVQMSGWKMIYDQETVVPAEVPSIMQAFKVQQFRWTKGIAQTAKKSLVHVLRFNMPVGKKLHSTFHLLSSFVFLCLLTNALLTIPVLILRNYYPEFIPLTNYTAISALNLIALMVLHYKANHATKNEKGFFYYYPVFLVVYLGMCVQNSVAVLQGFFGKPSAFVRTPKFSSAVSGSSSYVNKKIHWLTVLEMICLSYFLCGIVLSFWLHDFFLFLFFVMMCLGLSTLIYYTLRPIPKTAEQEKQASLLFAQSSHTNRKAS